MQKTYHFEEIELVFERFLQSDIGLHDAVEALEKHMICTALHQTRWHRGKTAKLLHIPRRTLQRKMLKYGLRPSS